MVLDVSGSMKGFPMNTAKQLLRNLVKGLRSEDTFNVIRFSTDSGAMSEEPMAATEANLALAMEFIDRQSPGGGTELCTAVEQALALPGGSDRSRSILLITDGYISTETAAADIVRKNIGQANLFTFGIGTSVNRELLEKVARAGGGEPVVVTSGKEAAPAAARFRELVSSPVLAKVRITAEGVELGWLGPDPHPDVFAARPLVITGTWKGEPTGRIVVRGIGGNGAAFEKSIDLAEAAAATGLDHPALPVLWARERVRHLEDLPKSADVVGEITALGMGYSLLTPYTSFLAVDETPREFSEMAQTVKQPLPMPKGVSETAVGGSGPVMVKNASVPEPGSVGLIAFLVVLLALQRQREL
ncbi:MAG: VWA domain-containing protein, partial [Verrucomicrobiaceae bacterium]